MASYYYLIASLPMLAFDREPPITGERFLELCRRDLQGKDVRYLEALLAGDDEALGAETGFPGQWHAFVSQVKAELHALRKARQATGGQADKGGETELARAVREA